MLDPDGTPVALGWRDGTDYWLEVPGVAVFGFRPGGDEIAAYALSDADAVHDAYLNLALPVALQVSGREVLHASSIERPEGIVGFCGLSGTGKTTTAYALSRRGHRLWGDDAIVLEPSPAGAVFAHPLPFRANLRAETVAAFASGEAPAPEGSGGEPAPLAALVVLERAGDAAGAGVERLEAKEALPALLPHCFRFDLTDRELRRATVRRYLSIVAAVPVLRASFVPSFDRLDAFLDELEAALAAV